MATVEGSQTAAAGLAVERFRLATDLALEGRSPYPDEAVFVAADIPNLGAIVARHALERRPIVLVYADGDERVLTPPAAPTIISRASGALRRLQRSRRPFRS